jgi:hypothetical protein
MAIRVRFVSNTPTSFRGSFSDQSAVEPKKKLTRSAIGSFVTDLEAALKRQLEIDAKAIGRDLTKEKMEGTRVRAIAYFDSEITQSLNKVAKRFLASQMFGVSGASTTTFTLTPSGRASTGQRFLTAGRQGFKPLTTTWTALDPDYLKKKRRQRRSSKFFVKRGTLRRALNSRLPDALRRFFPSKVGIQITPAKDGGAYDFNFNIGIDLYADIGLFSDSRAGSSARPVTAKLAQRKVLNRMGLDDLERKLNNGFSDDAGERNKGEKVRVTRPIRLSILLLVRYWYLYEFPKIVLGLRNEIANPYQTEPT